MTFTYILIAFPEQLPAPRNVALGAVADFGSSQRSAIPGGRGSCQAVRFRSAVARQEPPLIFMLAFTAS